MMLRARSEMISLQGLQGGAPSYILVKHPLYIGRYHQQQPIGDILELCEPQLNVIERGHHCLPKEVPRVHILEVPKPLTMVHSLQPS